MTSFLKTITLSALLFTSFFLIHAQKSINDFSRLNETPLQSLVAPHTYRELTEILANAQTKGLKISVAGSRHSQGGHAFYPQGVVIRLDKLNKIIRLEDTLLTVQVGITWKEVQEYLNPKGLAVKVMQFANFFTVGGSLSVNANGIDPHFGPLIETVHSLKIMRADGTIIHASRTEHDELFRLAIGGYGLFGIILEATLEVVKNDLYKKESHKLSIKEYCQELPSILKNSTTGFHYGQLVLNPWGDKLFSGIRSITFKKIDETSVNHRTRAKLQQLSQENLLWLRRTFFYYGRYSSLLKALQRDPDRLANGSLVSRNKIMSPHVSHMYYDSDKETDLLQEYFVPVAHLSTFLSHLDSTVRSIGINLFSAHVRFIPKDAESYLSYAKKDCMGIVILFSQSKTQEGHKNTELFTRSLIDKAITLDASYYLPIQLHATKKQLKNIYPRIESFFDLKKTYDPQELFSNHFYKKYA